MALKWLFILITCTLSVWGLRAQCDISDDYENPGNWTQIGSQVEITAGSVTFLDGSPCGEQRRVYRDLGITLDPGHAWTVEVDFNVLFVGSTPTGPAVGHNIVALTAGTQEPLSDCPDVECTGNPQSTQDGIMVTYVTPNPPDGSMGFAIIATDDGKEESSERIPGNIVDTDYFITLERTGSDNATLSIFSDAARMTHVDGSPVSLALPPGLGGLTHVQHSNHARGTSERQLTGTVDNLCIMHPLTSTSEVIPDDDLVYPNPVNRLLYFRGESPEKATLFHPTGHVAGTWELPNTIGVGHLPPGTYLLMTERDGEHRVQRIVKQ